MAMLYRQATLPQTEAVSTGRPRAYQLQPVTDYSRQRRSDAAHNCPCPATKSRPPPNFIDSHRHCFAGFVTWLAFKVWEISPFSYSAGGSISQARHSNKSGDFRILPLFPNLLPVLLTAKSVGFLAHNTIKMGDRLTR